MCYEFDEMYWKAREADEARRKKLADDLRKRDGSSSSAKPTSPEKGVREKEPVPA